MEPDGLFTAIELDKLYDALLKARKEGRREVVEWIAEHVTNQSVNPTIFPRTAWQQKVKEWGIE